MKQDPKLAESAKEQALEYLKTLDQTTVVDSAWWEYFYRDTQTLQALLTATGLKSYKEICDKYEGFDIEELITEIKYPTIMFDDDGEPIRHGDNYYLYVDGKIFYLTAIHNNKFSDMNYLVRYKSAESMLNHLINK